MKQLNRVSISVSLGLGLWLVLGVVLGLVLGFVPSSDIVLKSTVLSSSCVPKAVFPSFWLQPMLRPIYRTMGTMKPSYRRIFTCTEKDVLFQILLS